jgi:hypothetical protein
MVQREREMYLDWFFGRMHTMNMAGGAVVIKKN